MEVCAVRIYRIPWLVFVVLLPVVGKAQCALHIMVEWVKGGRSSDCVEVSVLSIADKSLVLSLLGFPEFQRMLEGKDAP